MGAVLLALTRGSEPNRDISEAISTDGCLQVYANKVHTESGIPINTTCLPLTHTHTRLAFPQNPSSRTRLYLPVPNQLAHIN